MNNKVFYQSNGGLGNQMFQFAVAKSIAINNCAKLYVDTESGHRSDKIFKRNFQLDYIQLNKASYFDLLSFRYSSIQRFCKKKNIPLIGNKNLLVIDERDHRYFHEDIANIKINLDQKILLRGYWQSEKYFKKNAEYIYNDLKLNESKNNKFLEISELIQKSNSVAVGIRMYEEVKGEKSFMGGVTNINYYNSAIKKISKQIANPTFFIFSTENFRILKEIEIKQKKFYLTPENGFDNPLETLWLLSLCKNHIISNSSYYWWGAWLAEMNYKNSLIYTPSNFSNIDAIPDRWIIIK